MTTTVVAEEEKQIMPGSVVEATDNPGTVARMPDETTKPTLFQRPGFQFALAGLWLAFGVVEFFVADGFRRWFTLGCGLLLTVLYLVNGIVTLRKARRARADLFPDKP